MAGAAMPYEPALGCAEWAARAALWSGDARGARAALSLFEARPERGRAVAAKAAELRAGIQALDGQAGAARAGYRDAIRAWRDLDAPFYLGLALLGSATLVGPGEPEARAAADEARAIFSRLGSPPLLGRLDAGLARWPQSRPGAGVSAPAAADGVAGASVADATAAQPG